MTDRYLRLLSCAIALMLPLISTAQNTVTVGETTLAVRDVVTGIDIPWEIIWGPDDHIWFTERAGRISRLDPETGQRTVLLNITSTVHQVSEAGMLGMVLHPDFPETPHLFVAYTYLAGFNNIRERIVRYTYDGDELVEPFTLLENIPGASTHNGCRLLILPDNTLIATTGDAQQPNNFSQNLESLAGKVLRMNLDGSIPADNPFGPDSYVYAYGFRNTQGLAFGPDGKIYSSEHGPDTNDEFNVIEPGKNYGWPLINGFCTLPAEVQHCESWDNYADPLTVWFTASTIAPSDLIWYDHPSIPEWEGRFLMTVLKNKHVRAIRVDETNGTEVLEDVEYLNDVFGRLRDICTAPDGRVFLATNGPFWSNTQPNTHKIVELKNAAFDPLGVEHALAADIRLYPNPVADKLQVRINGSERVLSFRAMDPLGRTVLVANGSEIGTAHLDVSGLSAGVYTLAIDTERGAVVKRFIVSR